MPLPPWLRQPSLQFVIAVPFVLQILVLAGLLGAISLRNSEKSTEKLVQALLTETGNHISDNISDFLLSSVRVVDDNQHLLSAGVLPVDELSGWAPYLWNKSTNFNFLSNLVIANQGGNLVGAGTLLSPTGKVTRVIGYAAAETDYDVYAYTDLDRALAKAPPDLVAPSVDPRLRPFYTVGIQSDGPRWTPIHEGFDAAQNPNWVLALTQPLFVPNNPKPVAVSAIFLRLSYISDFLRSLQIGEAGQVFILERSGDLVASSTEKDLFKLIDGQMQRLKASDSTDRVTQQVTAALDLQAYTAPQNLSLDLLEEPYFLRVVPFQDEKGLDWLVVMAVPKADFMAEIDRNTRITGWVAVVAMGGAIGLSLLTARQIVRPLQRIDTAAKQLATGNLDHPVYRSRIQEVGTLGDAFNQMTQQLRESFQALEEANLNLEVTVKQRTAQLEVEKEKSEKLLLNILPSVIAQKLKQGSGLIADYAEEVSILFADIVGFTHLSAQLSPIQVVELLNYIFSAFDELADQFGLEKIKTIGDAYMVVAGLPVTRSDHAEAAAKMALAMQRVVASFSVAESKIPGLGNLQLRIGINTGTVVAGVIGIKKFNYDLWGDAVNVASRMESSGEAGQIQVTETTYEHLRDRYHFQQRGPVYIKGKGDMQTYWLLGQRSEAQLEARSEVQLETRSEARSEDAT